MTESRIIVELLVGRADMPYKLSIGFNKLETGSAEGLSATTDWVNKK